MESATVKRLLEEEKLTLIVDLDQTLIHATVGTAIDEWVNAQGEMPKVYIGNIDLLTFSSALGQILTTLTFPIYRISACFHCPTALHRTTLN